MKQAKITLPPINKDNKNIIENMNRIINIPDSNNSIPTLITTSKFGVSKNVIPKAKPIKPIKSSRKILLEGNALKIILSNENLKITNEKYDVIRKIKYGTSTTKDNTVFIKTRRMNGTENNLYSEFNLNTLLNNYQTKMNFLKGQTEEDIKDFEENVFFIDAANEKILRNNIDSLKDYKDAINSNIERVEFGNKQFTFKNSLFSQKDLEILNSNKVIKIKENFINKTLFPSSKKTLVTSKYLINDLNKINEQNIANISKINTKTNDSDHFISSKSKCNFKEKAKLKLNNDIKSEFKNLDNINQKIAKLYNDSIKEFNEDFQHYSDIENVDEENDQKLNIITEESDNISLNKNQVNRKSSMFKNGYVQNKVVLLEQKEINDIRLFL
jgi:hypothetical protein